MYAEIKKLGLELECGKGASDSDIESFESKLGLKVGEEYRAFLKEFGNLSVEYLEFYGICKSEDSIPSAVFATLNAREEINLYKDFIVVEEVGNGDFYCVDSKDNVYLFKYGEFDNPQNLNLTFKAFLLQQIKNI